MHPLHFLAKEITLNGHLQSLGAVGIVYITARALSLPWSVDMLLSVYLLLQIIYFFDRYIDLARDWTGNGKRSGHIASYRSAVPLVAAGYAIAAAFVLLRYAALGGIIFSVAAILFGLLYPRVFKPLTKNIPLFKNFYVSATFAVLLFFPFFYAGIPLAASRELFVLGCFIFISALTAQFLLDLKDALSDKEAGLKTAPALLGEHRALIFSMACSVFAAAAFVLFARNAFLSILALGALGADVLAGALIRKSNANGYLVAAAKFLLLGLLALAL